MSTNLSDKSGSKLSGIMWASIWFFACSLAWKGSTLSGGSHSAEAEQLAVTVGLYNHISLKCVLQAVDLADASIRAKIADYRPTARYLKMKEDRAIKEWHKAGCPDRALVGISYGVMKIAREDLASRKIAKRK